MLPTEKILNKCKGKSGKYEDSASLHAIAEYIGDEDKELKNYASKMGSARGLTAALFISWRRQEGIIGVVSRELSKHGIYIPAESLRTIWGKAYPEILVQYQKLYPDTSSKLDEELLRNIKNWEKDHVV